jgi:hypothetical protein
MELSNFNAEPSVSLDSSDGDDNVTELHDLNKLYSMKLPSNNNVKSFKIAENKIDSMIKK